MNTDEFEGHTEGLWTLCTWRDGRAEYDVVRDEGLDEDNNVIASIVGKWEERKSNMKLIAAAPELLAEVKRLQKILDIVQAHGDAVFDTYWALHDEKVCGGINENCFLCEEISKDQREPNTKDWRDYQDTDGVWKPHPQLEGEEE
jgi:seryl-tRNA synthetase